MTSFVVVLIFSIVLLLSFHEGESVKGLKVCKQDIPSNPNSRCKQPKCDDDCALKFPLIKSWGSCKFEDNENFVCECSYLCHHHGGGHRYPPSASPSIPPYNSYAPSSPTFYI